jgi:hypothetical protein
MVKTEEIRAVGAEEEAEINRDFSIRRIFPRDGRAQ